MTDVTWLLDVSPWWVAANIYQSLWCAAFRDWARPSGVFWISAALLTATAIALAGAEAVVTGPSVGTGSWTAVGQRVLAQMPLSLHFGWVTAASLVNWNSFFAVLYRDAHISLRTQIWLAFASLHLAYIVGSIVAVVRMDFLYSLTLAWALTAIKTDKGRRAQGLVEQKVLDSLSGTAGFGAMLCACISVCVFARASYTTLYY
mmetsp:Transcript_26192/g.56819  ORF Transcript_26192/g.56819 Transcript_26192/m.56819 type:complete len:203 (+) Transcript_26192:575-1183(+)